MTKEADLFSRVSTTYKSTHSEFLSRRGEAILYTVLLILGLVTGLIICFVNAGFEEGLRDYLKIMSAPAPLIISAGILAFWFGVLTAKARLEIVKGILEQEDYVIARKISGGDVKILKGPLDQITNCQYFDLHLVKELKSGKIKVANFPPETYLVAPLGRVNEHYVLLFRSV